MTEMKKSPAPKRTQSVAINGERATFFSDFNAKRKAVKESYEY